MQLTRIRLPSRSHVTASSRHRSLDTCSHKPIPSSSHPHPSTTYDTSPQYLLDITTCTSLLARTDLANSLHLVPTQSTRCCTSPLDTSASPTCPNSMPSHRKDTGRLTSPFQHLSTSQMHRRSDSDRYICMHAGVYWTHRPVLPLHGGGRAHAAVRRRSVSGAMLWYRVRRVRVVEARRGGVR